jgi:hypothetical protein
MPYLINPVENDRCVFVSYAGEMPSVELSTVRGEANRLLGQRRWGRLVIDVTQLQSAPTPAQLFDQTKAIAAEVPRGVRVALLIRPDQLEAARLIERIARHDGVVLAYFHDAAKALAWVKPREATQPTARATQEELL